MLRGLIAFLFAPALISLAVSLWANRRSEARRARRDHITKLFEVTREDIRRSVEVAMDYFATLPTDRTALQEAKVILADRELRSAMPVILGPHPELADKNRDDAEKRFVELLAELTGGNFQGVDGEVDRQHIIRLTYAAAGLRSALSRMRDAELKMLIEADPLLKMGDWCMVKFDRFLGIESKER
jgi:hypothetical protein